MGDLQPEVRHGTFVEPSRQTFDHYLEEWLAAIRPAVRPSTWASYDRNMRMHEAPRIGDIPLAVDAGAIAGHYAGLLADGHQDRDGGLLARTVSYIGTIVHRALKDAVRWGHIVRNPAELVDRPKSPGASSTVTA